MEDINHGDLALISIYPMRNSAYYFMNRFHNFGWKLVITIHIIMPLLIYFIFIRPRTIYEISENLLIVFIVTSLISPYLITWAVINIVSIQEIPYYVEFDSEFTDKYQSFENSVYSSLKDKQYKETEKKYLFRNDNNFVACISSQKREIKLIAPLYLIYNIYSHAEVDVSDYPPLIPVIKEKHRWISNFFVTIVD